MKDPKKVKEMEEAMQKKLAEGNAQLSELEKKEEEAKKQAANPDEKTEATK